MTDGQALQWSKWEIGQAVFHWWQKFRDTSLKTPFSTTFPCSKQNRTEHETMHAHTLATDITQTLAVPSEWGLTFCRLLLTACVLMPWDWTLLWSLCFVRSDWEKFQNYVTEEREEMLGSPEAVWRDWWHASGFLSRCLSCLYVFGILSTLPSLCFSLFNYHLSIYLLCVYLSHMGLYIYHLLKTFPPCATTSEGQCLKESSWISWDEYFPRILYLPGKKSCLHSLLWFAPRTRTATTASVKCLSRTQRDKCLVCDLICLPGSDYHFTCKCSDSVCMGSTD